MSAKKKLEEFEKRAVIIGQQLGTTGSPFVAPSYRETVMVAATAIGNVIAVQNNLEPRGDILDLFAEETRSMCVVFGKAAVDAVSAYGRKKAEEAGAEVSTLIAEKPVEEEKKFYCGFCGADAVSEELDEFGANTTNVKFACGGELLVFDAWTDKMQKRVRKECPASKVEVEVEVAG